MKDDNIMRRYTEELELLSGFALALGTAIKNKNLKQKRHKKTNQKT